MRDVAQPMEAGAVVLAVVLAGLLLARVLERAGLAPMIAVAMTGVVAGALVPQELQLTLGPEALAFFLPALIFEAAWDADAATLRRAAGAVAMLAGPGVLVTAAAVALAAVACGALPWPVAIVLGSLLAATDPVSVLATFRRFGFPHLLVMIVEGESVANDGVALVLVQTFVPLALVGAPHVAAAVAIVHMLVVSGGGTIVGIALAIPFGLALRARLPRAASIAVTVVVAYGSYALASALGLSGIFASAAAGIALRSMSTMRADGADAVAIDRAWDAFAFVVNAVVFALVGLTLRLDRLASEPLLLAGVVFAVGVSRLILAYVLMPLRGLTSDPLRWRHAVALAGLRGGLSLALAIGLPAGIAHREGLRDATFAVVFVTLIVQGVLGAPLLRNIAKNLSPDATSPVASGYSG